MCRLRVCGDGEALHMTVVIVLLAWFALSIAAGLLAGLMIKAADSVRVVPGRRSPGVSAAVYEYAARGQRQRRMDDRAAA